MNIIKTLNKFTCENEHEFYIPLNLPQAMSEIGSMLMKLKCPICDTKTINIHAKAYWLAGEKHAGFNSF